MEMCSADLAALFSDGQIAQYEEFLELTTSANARPAALTMWRIVQLRRIIAA